MLRRRTGQRTAVAGGDGGKWQRDNPQDHQSPQHARRGERRQQQQQQQQELQPNERGTFLEQMVESHSNVFVSNVYLARLCGHDFGICHGLYSTPTKGMFQGGGSLRFLGSALETLGSASTSLSTIVVAASLVPPLSAPLTSPSNAHAKPADTVQPEESSDSMPYLTLVDEERCNDPEQQQEDEQDDDDVDHVLDTCDFSSGTSRHKEEDHVRDNNNSHPINLRHNHAVDDHQCSTDLVVVYEENPVMTDPNFGPYQRKKRRWQLSGRFRGSRSSSRQQEERRSSLWTTNTMNPSLMFQLGRSFRSRSVRWLQTAVPRSRSEMGQLHLWFNLSRLVLTPAVIVGLILALDCAERRGGGGLLFNVPNLAKLVLIINAALPGALIVIVMLKSNPHLVSADTAATVAKAYLPQYLLSIFTIAAWTALGQYITLPDDDGYTLCQQEQRRP